MESRNPGEGALSCLPLPLLALLFLWLNIRSIAVLFKEVAGTAGKKEEVGVQERDLSQARPKHKID